MEHLDYHYALQHSYLLRTRFLMVFREHSQAILRPKREICRLQHGSEQQLSFLAIEFHLYVQSEIPQALQSSMSELAAAFMASFTT